MTAKISNTIDMITSSVIQFNTDIENNNPEALNKFIPGFVDLLKIFKNLMLQSENRQDKYCQNFKNEISKVFDYLFTDGNIYKITEYILRLNEDNEDKEDYGDTGIVGQLFAIKRNGNPLNDSNIILKKSSGFNSLKEFVSMYQGLYMNIESESNYVLKYESVILKLFEEFGIYFPEETKESWKKRWIYSDDNLTSIKTEKFKVGNNKHLLLTILHMAHPFMKVDKIEDYIRIKWGLKSYHSDISRYLNNPDIKPHPQTDRIKEILRLEQN